MTPAQVALAWLLAQKPWIVPIPGTTKLAHLQENFWSADVAFTAEELRGFTEAVSKMTIVGERYTWPQAQQTNRYEEGRVAADGKPAPDRWVRLHQRHVQDVGALLAFE